MRASNTREGAPKKFKMALLRLVLLLLQVLAITQSQAYQIRDSVAPMFDFMIMGTGEYSKVRASRVVVEDDGSNNFAPVYLARTTPLMADTGYIPFADVADSRYGPYEIRTLVEPDGDLYADGNEAQIVFGLSLLVILAALVGLGLAVLVDQHLLAHGHYAMHYASLYRAYRS